MKRLFVTILLGILAAPLAGQRPLIKASAGLALSDYREQSEVLDFRGQGPVGRVDLTWRRWGLTAAAERISFRPTDPDSPALPFHATTTEVALRFRVLRNVPAEAEVGVVRRTPSPRDRAQSLRAYRIGAVAHFILGEGAEVDTRAAWLANAEFSGGGSAGTAVTLGLRVAYRPLARFDRGWLVADYAFERFDRRTNAQVPLQDASLRVGIEGRFMP